MAGDFAANLTTREPGQDAKQQTVRVNHPIDMAGDRVYLMGNGYAPTITVRNPAGDVVFREDVEFLPQDTNMTSLGVVKVPDGLARAGGPRRLLLPDRRDAALRRVHVGLPGPRQSAAHRRRLRRRSRHRRRHPAERLRTRHEQHDPAHRPRHRRRLAQARTRSDRRPAERPRHHHVRRQHRDGGSRNRQALRVAVDPPRHRCPVRAAVRRHRPARPARRAVRAAPTPLGEGRPDRRGRRDSRVRRSRPRRRPRDRRRRRRSAAHPRAVARRRRTADRGIRGASDATSAGPSTARASTAPAAYRSDQDDTHTPA